MRSRPLHVHIGRGALRGTEYNIQRLYLEFGHAMLLLQGATIQSLLGPNYVFFGGGRSHPFAARVYLKDVQMAALHAVPEGMKLEEVVHVLRAAS